MGTLEYLRGLVKYQYSIRMPAGATVLPTVRGRDGDHRAGTARCRYSTGEDEAYRLSGELLKSWREDLGQPHSLDDVFFHLVGEEGSELMLRPAWVRQIAASVLVNAIYAMKNYPVVLVNTVLAPARLPGHGELRQQGRAARSGDRGGVHHEHVLERDGPPERPFPPQERLQAPGHGRQLPGLARRLRLRDGHV